MIRLLLNSKHKLLIIDTLFSGQTFTWKYFSDSTDFSARIIDNNPVFVSSLSDTEIEVVCEDSRIAGMLPQEFFRDYFSMDLDGRAAFPENFRLKYPDLWNTLEGYFPVRVLKQDPFETMVTFMCAQGIGMRIIRNQVSMLAEHYGTRFDVTFRDIPVTLHNFPSPQALASADAVKLSRCTNNNRIRARNIISASKAVCEGKIDFGSLRDKSLPLEQVRRKLCELDGIGYKIADCIALFGLGRFDAFPVDTHVKQFMSQWFGSSTASLPLTPANYLKIVAGAHQILVPELAGYAGHILFHCWRKEVKKLRSY
ncbi:MAG: Fe-S cluster assembly protein HesB [Chlorobiaceae bacterium]|nr:Fe-S cluster assembly protein HesB [Chlorobiaceae bacterium]